MVLFIDRMMSLRLEEKGRRGKGVDRKWGGKGEKDTMITSSL
jgi:hypothetical protein